MKSFAQRMQVSEVNIRPSATVVTFSPCERDHEALAMVTGSDGSNHARAQSGSPNPVEPSVIFCKVDVLYPPHCPPPKAGTVSVVTLAILD